MIEDNTQASEKQKDFMRKLHIEPSCGITKYQAKLAIDKGIADRDAKRAGADIQGQPVKEEFPVVKPGEAPSSPFQDDKTKNINMCVAIKGAIDLCCAGRIETDHILEKSEVLFNYLNS